MELQIHSNTKVSSTLKKEDIKEYFVDHIVFKIKRNKTPMDCLIM
jgi:hypothetical protein